MKEIISIIRKFIKGASEKNLSVYAAGSAFFVILSAVPMIVIVSCLLPVLGLSEEVLYGTLTRFMPKITEEFTISLVSYVYSNSSGILPIAVLVAVWSAGRGMLSLIRGLNEIHGIVEKRGYFKLRLVSSFYTIILLVGLLFTLVVSVFGHSIYEQFFLPFPFVNEIISLVLQFRYLIAILILSIIFTLLYTYVPNMKTTLKKQFYGGFSAALSCSVFSYCFGVYVDNFNDFSSYGSINIIIIIMLWLYFTMYILLYGAYLGSYFVREAEDEV